MPANQSPRRRKVVSYFFRTACIGEVRSEVTFSWNVSVEFGRVQRLQMGGLLENLASMGYLARSGIYLTESLVHYAESSHSRALLDDYRSCMELPQPSLGFVIP